MEAPLLRSATEGGQRGVLVIAYGNDLRGDDGAAMRAARRLSRRRGKARVVCVPQLLPELAAQIAVAARVVFVDAYAANDANAGLGVARIAALAVGAQAPAYAHRASPQQLLALAARLYGGLPEAWLIAIPAFDFAAGEQTSPATARCIEEAVVCCRALVRAGCPCRADRQSAKERR